MNNLRNSVHLIGHLGADPEVKKLENGKVLATASRATHEACKNTNGEYVDQTTWHRLVAWDKVAEKMEKQMKKGLEVTLQGKLVQRSYEDKKGEKRFVTEIRVSGFIMMDKDARKNNTPALAPQNS